MIHLDAISKEIGKKMRLSWIPHIPGQELLMCWAPVNEALDICKSTDVQIRLFPPYQCSLHTQHHWQQRERSAGAEAAAVVLH